MSRSAAVAWLSFLGACAPGPRPDGGPTFEVRTFEVGFPPADVAIADVDADGRPDVVVAGGDSVRVLAGDGAGGLRARRAVAAGPRAVGIAVADLDLDGWPEVVVANHESDRITLLSGGPEGPGADGPRPLPVEVRPHPHAVAAGDVDGDGWPDLLVDDRNARALALLRGGADGRFVASARIDVGGDPYRGMALADLDGDGRPDLITPNPAAVAIRRGDGRGRFHPWAELEARGLDPFSVGVGDLDGDGLADVAAGGGEGAGSAAVWLGRADGGFTQAPGSPWTLPRGPTGLAVGDVDGDGFDDVAITSYGGDAVTLLLGGRRRLRSVTADVEGSPWGVAVGDLDGDGRAEVVAASHGGTHVSVLRTRAP